MGGFANIADKIVAFFTNFGDNAFVYGLEFIGFAILFFFVFKTLVDNKGGKILFTFIALMLLFGFSFGVSNSINSDILVIIVFLFALLVFSMFGVEIKRNLLDSDAKNKVKREKLTVSHVEYIIEEMTDAIQNMSKNFVGALIVLSNENLPDGIISSGTVINADINAPMLEAVFFPKAPLHDGAVVIEGDKIHAAGCFLPLLRNDALPQEVGSRHRAALSVTVVASVTAIVVSEETGVISIIKNGEVRKKYANASDLRNALSDYYWSDLTAEN